jgi:hypothetical protein
LNFSSEEGGVRVYAGGQLQTGSQVPGSTQPNLSLEGKNITEVRAGTQVTIEAPAVNIQNANAVGIQALTAVSISAGDSIQQSSKTYSRVTTGKSTEVFGGPTDGLITNGPAREVTIVANPATGFIGGTSDKYQNVYGDRDETFLLGNHTTQCLVGNLTYQTLVGTVTTRSGVNQTQLSLAGNTTTLAIGNQTVTAVAGSITESSLLSTVHRTTGGMIVSGTASLALGGPGKVGPIVSGADLDPLTGLPLIALGMGSPGHFIITPV